MFFGSMMMFLFMIVCMVAMLFMMRMGAMHRSAAETGPARGRLRLTEASAPARQQIAQRPLRNTDRKRYDVLITSRKNSRHSLAIGSAKDMAERRAQALQT